MWLALGLALAPFVYADTHTSAATGAWSEAATWDVNEVPANGDTVVIATGHTVTFDVDQSAFAAGLAGLTIQTGGTLAFATDESDYYLKMAGHITNSGTIRAGTAETPVPYGTNITIYMNGNYQITNLATHAGKIYMYSAQPTNKYAVLISASPKAINSISSASPAIINCTSHGISKYETFYVYGTTGMPAINGQRLAAADVTTDTIEATWHTTYWNVDGALMGTYTSGGYLCPDQAEASGQTQIEIDRDLTEDSMWKDGTFGGTTVIRFDEWAVGTTPTSQALNYSNVSAGYLTMASGLSAARKSGSLAVLVTRNVSIRSSSTNVTNGMIRYGSGLVLNCEIRPGNTSTHGVADASSVTFGGVISGASSAFYKVPTVTATSDAVISGCTYGINAYYGTGTYTYAGLISGCSYGIGNASGTDSDITFSGLSSGVGVTSYFNRGAKITGTVRGGAATAQGCLGVEFSGYAYLQNPGYGYGAITTCADAVVGGLIANCGIAIYGSTGARLAGDVYGCGSGFEYSSGVSSGSRFSGVATIVNVSKVDMYAATATDTNYGYMSSSGRVVDSTLTLMSGHYPAGGDRQYVEVYNNGTFTAYTVHGTTTTVTSNLPSRLTRAYQTIGTSATHPGYYQRRFTLDPGQQLQIRLWGKAAANTDYRVQLILPKEDPLVTGSGSGVWERSLTANGTWTRVLEYHKNTNTYPIEVIVRFIVYNGTAYTYSEFAIDKRPGE